MKSSGKKIKNNPNLDAEILRIFLEAGLLKRIKRSGWWVVGINNPESVADHSFRTSLIGYFLAKKEKADPYPVLLMTLFGDFHEARINDLHKMGQRYIDFSSAENKVFSEQIKSLPKEISLELKGLREDLVKQASREAIISRDADILECLLQAKEYHSQGKKLAANFFQKAPLHLKTKSAKMFWQQIKNCAIDDWWMKLSEFKR